MATFEFLNDQFSPTAEDNRYLTQFSAHQIWHRRRMMLRVFSDDDDDIVDDDDDVIKTKRIRSKVSFKDLSLVFS